MAIQSVYTNLMALTLLLALSPLLLIATGAIAFFSGPGPVFESIECAGFQYIPFVCFASEPQGWMEPEQ